MSYVLTIWTQWTVDADARQMTMGNETVSAKMYLQSEETVMSETQHHELPLGAVQWPGIHTQNQVRKRQGLFRWWTPDSQQPALKPLAPRFPNIQESGKKSWASGKDAKVLVSKFNNILTTFVQISWRVTYFGVQISCRSTYLGGINFILQISSRCTYFECTNFLRGTTLVSQCTG